MTTRSPSAYAAETSVLVPEALYTLNGFIKCSGVAKTRIREARLQGVELPTLKVGRRSYIRGADAIAFVEQLAALTVEG